MQKKKVGILVGGGPAPGINGVISAVTIEAINRGYEVLGIRDGFQHLSRHDLTAADPLTIADVSTIHKEGGSVLRTSRANPTKNQKDLDNVVQSMKELGVGYLVTIGGDDTAHSARVVAEAAGGSIAVGHVPKTIDNDLPLPGLQATFGFESAREVGTEIVETLMVDARTTGRWYIVVAMGRKAGHLALGIGISAGATLTVIPEQFGDQPVPLSHVVDIIAGSVIKRYANGKRYGVVVLAEGLAEKVEPDSLPQLESIERDPHGHIRYAELDFGRIVKNEVRARIKQFNVPIPVVDKDVGYELRCHPPVPFDREYTRELGYGIISYLLDGGTNCMITRQGDRLVTVPLSEMVDQVTGRTRVRYVDVNSPVYRVARKYMIQLTEADLCDKVLMDRVSVVTNVPTDQFCKEFAAAAAEGARYQPQSET